MTVEISADRAANSFSQSLREKNCSNVRQVFKGTSKSLEPSHMDVACCNDSVLAHAADSSALACRRLDLSIILVNWNSLAYLRECLTSVYHHTRCTNFEVIVVDNASPEYGVDSLLTSFPEIVLIKSERNLGFAGANNLGFQRARGDFILLLNPDTLLIEDSIDLLLGHIRSLPDAGIVGCKLLNSDGSIQASSIKRFPTILNQAMEAEFLQTLWPGCPLWRLSPLFAKGVKVVPVDVIPGACMLMHREVFDQVGMLNEEYFMYAEDMDLNFKISQAGYTNYYVGETAVIHHGGGSSSTHTVTSWATVMQCRAMARYFRNTRGPLYQWLYEVSLALVAMARLTMLAATFVAGSRLIDQSRRRNSWTKWMSVLKWTLGKRDSAAVAVERRIETRAACAGSAEN